MLLLYLSLLISGGSVVILLFLKSSQLREGHFMERLLGIVHSELPSKYKH